MTHKDCVIADAPAIVPLMAGAALNERVPDRFLRDDIGDNISERNREFCELTGLYWAWKNYDARNIGLCHYRRYFASPSDRRRLLAADEAEMLLRDCDIILPKPRRYVIETNQSQYMNAHHATDLFLTRVIIGERHPEYLKAFDRRMAMRSGHRFNMFIMSKALADDYCEWLFDILFELERRLDISDYSEEDRRVFGYVAERLLDVWTDAMGLRARELSVIFPEGDPVPAKAASMIMRKLRGHARKE